MRWNHPQRGLLSPGEFIPLAEETGLILPIGTWVLREACRQLQAMARGGPGTPARGGESVGATVPGQEPAGDRAAALADAQLEPRFLELELTETAVMQDAGQSAAILRSLSEIGVRISVDDFGTGYSSLSYLQRFPLNKVKIDRSFVREIVRSHGDSEIVRAIVSLAHSLRLAVIAEGVETEEQLDFLNRIGCDQYQGYFCSPPVPPGDLATLVSRKLAASPDNKPTLNDTFSGPAPLPCLRNSS